MRQKLVTGNLEQNLLDPILKGLGFSQKESRVAKALFSLGRGVASQISKESGLKRGITYNALYRLEKAGIIRKYDKDKKTYFELEHPQKLKELVRLRQSDAEQLGKYIDDIAPKLISTYKIAVGKPTVRYFEGKEGIRQVFEDIYGPKKDIVYGCVDLERADEVFSSYIVGDLIPKRIENKVTAYSFVGDSPQAREISKQDKKQLRKTVLLDKVKYPLPAEIDVYEDKIAMLSFQKGEFVGIVVENQALAQSLRSIFKLGFDRTNSK